MLQVFLWLVVFLISCKLWVLLYIRIGFICKKNLLSVLLNTHVLKINLERKCLSIGQQKIKSTRENTEICTDVRRNIVKCKCLILDLTRINCISTHKIENFPRKRRNSRISTRNSLICSQISVFDRQIVHFLEKSVHISSKIMIKWAEKYCFN